MPFRSKDEEHLYDLIKKGVLDFSDDVWTEVSMGGNYSKAVPSFFYV